jgi:urease accessory protein
LILVPEAFCVELLRIFQLADSALPIGSLSHSFGLEAMIFDEDLDSSVGGAPASLRVYIEDALSESMLVDAVFCRAAHGRALIPVPALDLNQQLSAIRFGRETREASLALGRRFASLVNQLHPTDAFATLATLEELHHCVAFGYVFGILGIDDDLTVSAFLHQSVLNTISAAQRLLPLGQVQANRIAWDLKPAIQKAVKTTRETAFSTVSAFAHLPELASMRHAFLPTRLFIS